MAKNELDGTNKFFCSAVLVWTVLKNLVVLLWQTNIVLWHNHMVQTREKAWPKASLKTMTKNRNSEMTTEWK